MRFVNPPRSALGAFLGSPPSRVEMSEIAELISELNASAQIAYTSFRTYSLGPVLRKHSLALESRFFS